MNKFVLRQSALLVLTALIWGSAFVAQSAGMELVGPFTYSFARNILGTVVLIPVILLLKKLEQKKPEAEQSAVYINVFNKNTIVGGICCGLVLCVAANLQQVALTTSSAGKAGFLTAMYIVMVPILGIFMHKKTGIKLWIGVALAVVGLYLLCVNDNSGLIKEDYLLLLCALVFSVHILVIDYFSPKANGVAMSAIQFFVCGILSGIVMLIFENPDVIQILKCWLPICYAGVLSSGVAYTLQIVAQKGMNPTVASLIMSLESVFALLTGWLVLKERFSAKELIGCLIMFIAIILAQLPEKSKDRG